MSEPLFFFSQLNPLDNCPLHWIKAADIVGKQVKFKLVDDTGLRCELSKPLNPFLQIQIDEFGIETIKVAA